MKRLIYIFCMLLLLFWLIFSNNIILYINQVEKVIPESINNYSAHNTVKFSIGTKDEMNDLLETSFFSGWAYISTLEDNRNRFVRLLFESQDNKKIYRVNCIVRLGEGYDGFIIRPDVRSAFSQDSIPRQEVGFVANFSTLNLPNGEYRMYLYCYENDTNFGIIDTNLNFCKNGHSFSQVQ